MTKELVVLNKELSEVQSYFYQCIYVSFLQLVQQVVGRYEYKSTRVPSPSIPTNKYELQAAIVKVADDICRYEHATVAVIVPLRAAYPIDPNSKVVYIEYTDCYNIYKAYDVVILSSEDSDSYNRSVPAVINAVARTGCNKIIFV